MTPEQEELAHLRAQRDALQASMTRLVAENRGLREELAIRRAAFDAASPVADRAADVRRFFAEVSGQEIGSSPHVPSLERLQLHLRIMLEEVVETVEACGAGHYAVSDLKAAVRDAIHSIGAEDPDLTKIADGCIDILYTAEGLLVGCGIDSGPLWDEVHANNMKKADGPVVNGKKLKPPGHQPPDIAGCLRAQGWRS